ncbi:NAD-dependent epimerase/dehydratase family protein [Oleidesulfovibrio sp.]|uniref:NAD-dependent epimerase/dehydratase family protein n=1 Tax=Oleidesulfovibrio sp. TaxID=2909707 RepID=UPI003A83AA3B
MKRQTILITGATGFIGSHVLRQLADKHTVVGLSATSYPSADQKNRIERMILPHQDLEELIAELVPDEIIHCAGVASVGLSMTRPGVDFQSGPPVVFQIFDAVRKCRLNTRIMLMSSAAVYGNPATLPIQESTPAAPISPYGWHKLMCEQIAQEYADIYGISSYSLRIFSCYGDGLRKQLLWDVARKIQSNALSLSGTGKETRDFIHVRDVARLVELLIHEKVHNRHTILNVASGTQTSVRQIADTLRASFGYTPEAVFDGKVRSGDPAHWQADVSAISGMGFTPKISIGQGIADYAQWFKAAMNAAKQ